MPIAVSGGGASSEDTSSRRVGVGGNEEQWGCRGPPGASESSLEPAGTRPRPGRPGRVPAGSACACLRSPIGLPADLLERRRRFPLLAVSLEEVLGGRGISLRPSTGVVAGGWVARHGLCEGALEPSGAGSAAADRIIRLPRPSPRRVPRQNSRTIRIWRRDDDHVARNARSRPVDLLSCQSTAALRCCETMLATKFERPLLRRSLPLAFLAQHPSRFSSEPRASRSYGRRSCDRRTSKQVVGMAGVVSGGKVAEAQCLQGFGAQSWRDPAHGRRPSWLSRRPSRSGLEGQSCLVDAGCRAATRGRAER